MGLAHGPSRRFEAVTLRSVEHGRSRLNQEEERLRRVLVLRSIKPRQRYGGFSIELQQRAHVVREILFLVVLIARLPCVCKQAKW